MTLIFKITRVKYCKNYYTTSKTHTFDPTDIEVEEYDPPPFEMLLECC